MPTFDEGCEVFLISCGSWKSHAGLLGLVLPGSDIGLPLENSSKVSRTDLCYIFL